MGEQDGGVERLRVVPVELGELVLYRDLLSGGAALSVRIRGLTLTAAWDGSEATAETLVDGAAWNYAEQLRAEEWLGGG